MQGILKITIDQQLAEIGVRRTPAHMRIESPHMRMQIETESPEMEIERRAPTFKVNRKKINSESGLKAPDELVKVVRDTGKVAALRSSRRAVEDGNFLGNLKDQGDRVAKLAHERAMQRALKRRQSNIGLMPKTIAEIEWDKGDMRINWSKHSVVIDWDGDYMPQVTIDPKHSIEVFLRTEPYFRVNVVQEDDPMMPGRIFDKAI